MRTRGQGGVKRLITKLVDIFMCNGARRLSNQCFLPGGGSSLSRARGMSGVRVASAFLALTE